MQVVKVSVGDRVRDVVTGFAGIVVARTEWLHGCIRVTVQPEKLGKDGKPWDTQTFDEPQVKVLRAHAIAAPLLAAVRPISLTVAQARKLARDILKMPRKIRPQPARRHGPRDDAAALRRQA